MGKQNHEEAINVKQFISMSPCPLPPPTPFKHCPYPIESHKKFLVAASDIFANDLAKRLCKKLQQRTEGYLHTTNVQEHSFLIEKHVIPNSALIAFLTEAPAIDTKPVTAKVMAQRSKETQLFKTSAPNTNNR